MSDEPKKVPGIDMEHAHGNTFRIHAPGQAVPPISMKHSNGNDIAVNAPSAEVAALEIKAQVVRDFTALLSAVEPWDPKTFSDLTTAANGLLGPAEQKKKSLSFLQEILKTAVSEGAKAAVAWLLAHFPK